VFLPKWSPDEQQIAFSGQLPGESYTVYVVPAAGGPPRQVLAPGSDWLRDPCWSPDGKKLVFERYSPVSGKARLQQVDFVTHQTSSLPGGDNAGSPRWSPDGRYLAALASGSQRLLLLDSATGTWSALLQLNVGYPNWSHDGEYVYFDRFTDPPGIGRVRVSDRRVEQLVNLKGHDQLWTLDTWLGLTPDDAPLLLRDVSIEEVYALDLVER
jgi:Tol biopolymer transport system component